MQLMEFNSILHQQNGKVSRYSGYLQGDKIISSTLSWVIYFLTSLLHTNHTTIPTNIYSSLCIPPKTHSPSLQPPNKKLDIVPPNSTTSNYLSKSDLDNIHNGIKAMTDKHHSDMKTLSYHIYAMLEKLTDTSSKTDKQEEQLTDISS